MLRRASFAIVITVAAAALLPASGEVFAKQRSPADNALFDKAVRDCNGPHYPNGARMDINYKKGTYRCIEPTNHDRR